MIFQETRLPGAYLIALEKIRDERGFFARSWCRREFSDRGLDSELVQCNLSYNRRALTLRGMHYQIPPYAETKLIRCTRGSIYDVLIDIRPDSPTFLNHISVEVSHANGLMVYAPKGFAHGFLTLEDDTEVFYQMSEYYSQDHARGVRWNDPLFGIAWPKDCEVISEKDRDYPDSSPEQFSALEALIERE